MADLMTPRYTIDKAPSVIKTINKVEIYEKGCELTLFYGEMYKYPGAIFGISVQRGVEALNKGDAIELDAYKKHNYL